MRGFLDNFLDSLLHPGVRQVDQKGERVEENRRDGTQVASSSTWTSQLGNMNRVDLDDQVLVHQPSSHALYEGWSRNDLSLRLTRDFYYQYI